MAKKKNLKDVDALDMAIIEEHMSNDSILNYIAPNGLVDVKMLKTMNFKVDIKCKNEKQKEFLNCLKEKQKELCFGIGSPGTGKSFISLSYALKELRDGNFSKIVMIIPTAQSVEKDMSLGFLKGTFEEKTCMFKEADKSTIEKILKMSGNQDAHSIASKLVNSNLIQYEFANFLLGKTIDNSIILVNEAEQYTKDNMRLILTRIGDNSKIIVTGDSLQTSRSSIKNKVNVSGLNYAVDTLSDMEEVSVTRFTDEDIVRNKLITKILKKWDV